MEMGILHSLERGRPKIPTMGKQLSGGLSVKDMSKQKAQSMVDYYNAMGARNPPKEYYEPQKY